MMEKEILTDLFPTIRSALGGIMAVSIMCMIPLAAITFSTDMLTLLIITPDDCIYNKG